MSFLKKNSLIIGGLVIGSALGYAYYHYIGCHTGHCAITSKPLNSTIYGAITGALFLSLFDNKTKNKNNHQ